MKRYRLVALRSVLAICEFGGHYFVGNHHIKLFKTMKEAKEFLKSDFFKELDMLIPVVWYIEKIEERENGN